MAAEAMARKKQIISADSLVGERVVDPQGEELGHLEELMVEPSSGRLAYAVLALDGLFGMGDKLFAVPWRSLRFIGEDRRLVLDMDREKLKEAPAFDRHNRPEMEEASWGEEVHRYYGQLPYWQEYFADKTQPRQQGGNKNPSPFH